MMPMPRRILAPRDTGGRLAPAGGARMAGAGGPRGAGTGRIPPITGAVIAYQGVGLPCPVVCTHLWKGLTMTPLRTLASAALLTLIGGASASAAAQSLPPLSQNTYVTDRLVAARVADRIRKTCPKISARLFYAFTQARALKSYALDQGYTGDQIDSYLDDKTEKKKIYATAEDYLAKNGATEGNIDGFCALGLKEIADKTIAGSLLSAN